VSLQPATLSIKQCNANARINFEPVISQVHLTISWYSKITFVWPTEFQYKSSLQRAYNHSHTTVSQYRFLLLKAQPIILQETAKVNKYGKTEESETKILGVTGTYLLYKEKKIYICQI